MILVLLNFYLISKYSVWNVLLPPFLPPSLPPSFLYRIHWEIWKILIMLNHSLTFLRYNRIWLLSVCSCIKTPKYTHVSQSTSHSNMPSTHSSATLICYQSSQWASCNCSLPMVSCMIIVLSCPKGKHVKGGIWFYRFNFSFSHHIFFHIFLF